MFLGIFTQDNEIEIEKFNTQKSAYTWMYGKMFASLKEDCDCMNHLEALEGCIRFLGGGTFLVEDDDSMMGEGTIMNDSVGYDAVYGHSFAIRVVDLGIL